VDQPAAATAAQFRIAGIANLIVGSAGGSDNFYDANNQIFRTGGGSELMRLTGTGLGIGTSSPGHKLDISGADGVRARVVATSGGTSGLILTSAGNTAYTIKSGNADNSLRIDQDGTDRITLASGGNLGIGTSSPAGRLEVQSSNTSRWWLENDASATNTKMVFANSGGTVNRARYQASEHYWQVSGVTDAAILDSSGNLGLGVTPSAWSVLRGFDVSTSGGFFGHSAQAGLSNNAFFNGTNWIYKNTAGAAFFRATVGSFEWHTAPSGTAGNAISFTQAMTLDASGNLLVGGTTQLYGAAGRGLIQVSGSTEALLGFGTTGNTGLGFVYHTGTNFEVTNAQNGYLRFGTNNTERARFSAAGNFGIGTISPVARLDVNGDIATSSASGGRLILRETDGTRENTLVSGADASGSYINASFATGGTAVLRFQTANTERARITSGGDLLVGTTDTGAAGLGVSNLLNLTFPEGSGTSYANVFRQASSAATVIANGYKRSANANAFASSVGTSWAKSAIALNTGDIAFYADPAGTVANGTDVTPTERFRVKSTGQARFLPLAADPSGAADGDVYYNSTTNKLRVRAGGAWVDLH
jgi:hypothetical protein